MGIYELNINGEKVGDRYFAPGFTSDKNNLQYQTYDVTDVLRGGDELRVVAAGDIAVFSPVACYNFNTSRFLNKWMLDLQAEQLPSGGVPNTIPLHGFGFPATMPVMAVAWWDDACILVPWNEYRARGDAEILRKYYPGMKNGWNTAPDGSGVSVGLGSRIERAEGLILYAQWMQESPASAFEYITDREEIHITGYSGSGKTCVVPQYIEGRKVTKICTGVFRDAKIDTLVLPPSIFTVEDGAFAGSGIREVYLCDSLRYIYDGSFAGCENLTTLHINAVTNPVYSGSYYDGFSDRYDWLLSIREQKKIVLFSGSSARYGYDSIMIKEAFPEYPCHHPGEHAGCPENAP